MKSLWTVAILPLLATLQVRSEMFTALVEMEKLLSTEEELIDFLNKYIQKEEALIQQLKLYLLNYEKQWREASRDIQKYLQNPINAYLMVKSLSSDWNAVEKLMAQNTLYMQNFTTKKATLIFPSDEDLSGAAAALMRLQDTYQLETSALARGEILGTVLTSQLKTGDCFELGRQAYNLGSHYHTILWMQEALGRIENEKNATVGEPDILEYLAFSNYMQGNVRGAMKFTKDILEIAPNHMAARNIPYYEDAIKKMEETKDGAAISETMTVNKGTLALEYAGKEVYEKLCRGESVKLDRRPQEVVCRYTSSNHPFYLMQPFKEEEMSKNPYIVVYHDLMYDNEIEIIKELSSPRLDRAKVQDSVTGNLIPANYRISKSAWLNNEDHAVVAGISRRLEAVTRLTMNTAEPLQVVNYGIGGHYEPHYDFARKEEVNAFQGLGTGNRIATVLFYMSDVDAGGATVFPEIGIALWPKKGSAAFWYNLYRSGDGDLNTRHAGCPVLAGSKWVSNKWIHEKGQEFRYPCGLKQNEEH